MQNFQRIFILNQFLFQLFKGKRNIILTKPQIFANYFVIKNVYLKIKNCIIWFRLNISY